MLSRSRSFLSSLLALGLIIFSFGKGISFAGSTDSAPDSQTALQKQIQRKLLMLPWYGVFDNLEFQVDGSQVTLIGQVTMPVVKSEAVDAVKRIAGVSSVVDQIEVLPLSPFDNGIRRAEYRAIYSLPSLSRYGMGVNPAIHIIVDDGHVTLVGIVDSKADSDAANIRANGVPGVFSVTNDLHYSR